MIMNITENLLAHLAELLLGNRRFGRISLKTIQFKGHSFYGCKKMHFFLILSVVRNLGRFISTHINLKSTASILQMLQMNLRTKALWTINVT